MTPQVDQWTNNKPTEILFLAAMSSMPNVQSLPDTPRGLSKVVKNHYNNLQEKGLEARKDSRIFHMRSFNNWIKSMLIAEALEQCRGGNPDRKVTVLDIGCGKGGDLQKYRIGGISHLICTDIADESLKQCQDRYNEMVNRTRGWNNRGPSNTYSMESVVADSTKDRLRDKYKNPDISIDLVSIQFVFHYSFESIEQAEIMLRNISENLRIGGFWVGTTPNAMEIVRRARKAKSLSFGNDIYKITFNDEKILDKDYKIPLFGSTYTFKLDDCVVDCPEFLVYFPVLEKMAAKYGLRPCFKKTFEEFYKEHKDKPDGKNLLKRMNALTAYPPLNDPLLTITDTSEYEEAESFRNKNNVRTVGTISKSEWEAITLYLVFAFIKVAPIEEEDIPSSKRSKKE